MPANSIPAEWNKSWRVNRDVESVLVDVHLNRIGSSLINLSSVSRGIHSSLFDEKYPRKTPERKLLDANENRFYTRPLSFYCPANFRGPRAEDLIHRNKIVGEEESRGGSRVVRHGL